MDLLLVNLFLLLGGLLQGIIGYGLGILSVPLVFLVMPEMVPGPMLLNSICLCLVMAYHERKAIDFKLLSWPLFGGVAGILLAAQFLAQIDARTFGLVFAITLIILITLSLVKFVPPLNRLTGYAAGFLSTFSTVITAIGGPPLALIWQNLKPATIRANLSMFFIFSSVFSLIALSNIGLFGSNELMLSALTMPGVIVGFLLSKAIVNKMPSHFIRYGILLVSSVSSILLLVKYI